MTEPTGPIYLCYDADLQEDPIEHPVAMPSPKAAKSPTRMAADPDALIASQICSRAERPVIRRPKFWPRSCPAPATSSSGRDTRNPR